jgi:hypothetical protein
VLASVMPYFAQAASTSAARLERHLRNAIAARQHIAVSEEFYETAGQLRIEAAATARAAEAREVRC